MRAIILDRNKQYFVKTGTLIKVDYLDLPIGEVLSFKKILLFCDGEQIVYGDPFLLDKVVLSKVHNHVKERKVKVVKFKRRKNYLRRYGSRSKYTLLEITSIANK